MTIRRRHPLVRPLTVTPAAVPAAAVRLPPAGHDAEEVREVVRNVLARPAFAESQPGFAAQAWDWLLDAVGRFLSLLGGSAVGQVAFSTLLVALVAAVMIGVVAFARRIRRSGGGRVDDVLGPVGRTADEWREAAREAEHRGDLREAVRGWYRALVGDAASRGLVEEIPGRTAGQYLAAIRQEVPAAAEAFRRATRTFEEAWYGSHAVTVDDVRRIERDAEAAVRALDAPRRADEVPVGAAP